MAIDLTRYAQRSTLRLTTTGRRSGRPHTVPIWFVVADARRLFVHHVRGPDTDWYRNLCRNAAVQIDFGDGAVAACATPLAEREEIRRVLALVRRKYLMAWVFQLLGMTRQAVAVTIELKD